MTATTDTPTPAPQASDSPSRLPLLGALVVGLLCAFLVNFVVPGMFRLSSLSYLLFYLGLFFFLLYGLLIGAIMFRVGRSARPAPKGQALLVGVIVILAIWGGGLYQEYLTSTETVVDAMAMEIKGQITLDQMEDFEQAVDRTLHEQWDKQYPPGGFLGFLRWMATGRPIEFTFGNTDDVYLLTAPQRGGGFIFRIVVSLGLLSFSVLCLFLDVASAPRPADAVQPAPTETPGEPGDEPAAHRSESTSKSIPE